MVEHTSQATSTPSNFGPVDCRGLEGEIAGSSPGLANIFGFFLLIWECLNIPKRLS
jgi:hypothetical protein